MASLICIKHLKYYVKMSLNNNESKKLTLLELNQYVSSAINQTFPQGSWVSAETSDVRINASSGHCYLDFIEKDTTGRKTLARARGIIWNNTFRELNKVFRQSTGQDFSSGIKVLVFVKVTFHEMYGYSLTVEKIDPSYTLGDMARRRIEIINRLKEEGVFELNKELLLPIFIQRIALITSATAAGKEDFIKQLTDNKEGFPFYIKLFPAVMQGEKTEESIIKALDQINKQIDLFDVVVITRGGGATSELNSFDTYLLAANCAQFPIPIITGIGHERDDTLVDLVAHTRLKTPTAIADFLIHHMNLLAKELNEITNNFVKVTTYALHEQKNNIKLIGARFPALISKRIERNRSTLLALGERIPAFSQRFMANKEKEVSLLSQQLKQKITTKLERAKRDLELKQQFIQMASPDYVLKRGYSLTSSNGHIIKSTADLQEGATLTTLFKDGKATSIITQINKDQ